MKAQQLKNTCPRLFEVEALRDGRLSGSEVTHFQNHLRVCNVCAEEVAALQSLAEGLRSPTTSRDADELRVRRERTRLLAAFDASLVPTPSRLGTTRWLAAAAVIALLALVTVVAVRVRPARPFPPMAAASDAVKVHATTDAKWSRRAENELETITLQAGTLSIVVDHHLPHRRLLVLLPDGELEDVGTTFSVSAAASRTTEVSVQDGSVILRLRNLPAITLRAGNSWIPAPTPVIAVPAPEPPSIPSARRAKPATPAAPSSSNSAPPAPTASASNGSEVPDGTFHADPAADFRSAMAAFSSGDNERAARLFASFISQHPRDSHAEDAAYLRVLALQRASDATAMKQASDDYLTRYPRGFRRAEVEKLSRAHEAVHRAPSE